MNKIYPLSFLLFLSACSSTVRYVGEALPATEKVDVYIARESIKKPFEFMGRGYVYKLGGFINQENIQRKAIKLAKEKGADAVLITDQYFFEASSVGVGILGSDSTARSGISSVQTYPYSQLNILFIRYTQ